MNNKSSKLKNNGSSVGAYFKRYWPLYTMLLPMLVYFFIFNYWPMAGLQLAFKDWKLMRGMWDSPWAKTDGQLDLFKHFKLLFGDATVRGKFFNTLRIASLRLVCGFPVPIILALSLNEVTSSKFKKLVQTLSYLPHFISWVIIAGILFSLCSTEGVISVIYKGIFGKDLMVFSIDTQFIIMLIISDIWKGAGWGTVIYFAALTSIDPTLYEAATVDGAGRGNRTLHITLPGILPAVSINMIFSLSGIVNGGFDQVYNLMNPVLYTGKGDILETYLFRIGIVSGKYDVATALGLFNSLIGFFLTLTVNFVVKRMGGEGIW